MPTHLHRTSEVVRDIKRKATDYLEFLRVPAMSAGVYVLPVGAVDRQLPHTEDEIYYVLRGKGKFRQDGHDHAVEAGDVLFVPANASHRFHTIEDELQLLVVFAPAERPAA